MSGFKSRCPIPGVDILRNPKNKFVVFQLHFRANPAKRAPTYLESIKNAMPLAQFRQEYDLVWDSFAGLPVYGDFDEKRHVPQICPEPWSGLPLLRAWDFGLCYSDKTEVLTDTGWKFFRDVCIDTDRVATLNPKTFAMTYVKPEMKIDMPFQGEMLRLDSTSLRVTMTPDHIVPVWRENGEFVRKYAKDLFRCPSHDRLRMTAHWLADDLSNPLKLPADVFAGFMGAYLSEGSVDKCKNRVVIYQETKSSCLDV